MTEEKKLKIDPNAWTYREFESFRAALTSGNTSGLRKAYALAEQAIVAWDYDEKVGKGALTRLPTLEATKVLKAVLDRVASFADTVSTSGVDVDLSGWSMDKYFEWLALIESGKIEAAEEWIHEVAKMQGVEEGVPMTFAQGAAMFRAVQKEWSDTVSGAKF